MKVILSPILLLSAIVLFIVVAEAAKYNQETGNGKKLKKSKEFTEKSTIEEGTQEKKFNQKGKEFKDKKAKFENKAEKKSKQYKIKSAKKEKIAKEIPVENVENVKPENQNKDLKSKEKQMKIHKNDPKVVENKIPEQKFENIPENSEVEKNKRQKREIPNKKEEIKEMPKETSEVLKNEEKSSSNAENKNKLESGVEKNFTETKCSCSCPDKKVAEIPLDVCQKSTDKISPDLNNEFCISNQIESV